MMFSALRGNATAFPGHPFLEDESTPTPASRWAGPALVLLVLAAYFPAFNAGFVWLDDRNVTQSPVLRTDDGLRRIWIEPGATLRFQPLAHTAFWVEHHLWGNDPLGYHSVGVGLHAAVVLLLWVLLRRLSVPGPWLVAALFAVHPANVGTVAWVSQQGTVLAALFAVAALLGYLRWCDATPAEQEYEERRFHFGLPERPIARYAVSLLLVAAAMICDPAAVGWPVAAALLVRWRRGPLNRADWAFLAPAALLAAVAPVLAVSWSRVEYVMGTTPSVSARLLRAGEDFGLSLLKALVPAPSVMHFDPSPTSIVASAAVGLLFIGGAACWLPGLSRRLPVGMPISITLYMACGYLSAVLSLDGAGADGGLRGQAFYLIAVAPITLITTAACRLLRTRFVNGSSLIRFRFVALCGACLVVALCALTVLTQPRYADAVSYWTLRRSDAAGEGLTHRRLGDLAAADRSLFTATQHYVAALRADPRNAEAAARLSGILVTLCDYDRAADTLTIAFEASPDDAALLAALAQVEARRSRPDLAAKHYLVALAARPNDARIRNDYGLILANNGAVAEAAEQFRQAVAADPAYPAARVNLSTIYFRQGRLSEAAGQLQAAVKSDPGNLEAYINAGAMLASMKCYVPAEQMLRSALVLKHDSRDAWSNLAVVLKAQGKLNEAKWCNAQSNR